MCCVIYTTNRGLRPFLATALGFLLAWWLCDLFDEEISNFRFVPYRSFLHQVYLPVAATIVYVIGIKVVPYCMQDRKPMGLKSLIVAHNYFLSVLSMLMSVKIVEQVGIFFIMGLVDQTKLLLGLSPLEKSWTAVSSM